MKVTEENYRIVKLQIIAIRNQLQRELLRNYDLIKSLEKRQIEIRTEWESFASKMEEIGEFELESEYKFLIEIERNCQRCGRLYDKRKGSEKLCPICLTSNA